MQGIRRLSGGRSIFRLVALMLLASTAAAEAPATDPEAARIQAIAEEAYIYGLPIVMNYSVMYAFSVDRNSPQFKAPFNQLYSEARVFTPKDTAIVTPNSDTPYSFAWLDLRAEPMVISVPAMPADRYYSVMLCDGNTFNYGLFGSLSTGLAPATTLPSDPTGRVKSPRASSRSSVRPRIFR